MTPRDPFEIWDCLGCGTLAPHPCISRPCANAPERDALIEIARLRALLHTPETVDFLRGVEIEAGHQRDRWGSDHDAGKTPFDWFWLIGYLAQKAAAAAVYGEADRARHHTISTAAALANWHLALCGADVQMRPSILPPKAVD